MDGLIANYKRLLRLTDTSFHRCMYDKVNWNGRLVGIVGARGVGKTTMILQYIKEQLDVDSTLYVNAEDFYFHKPVACDWRPDCFSCFGLLGWRTDF